MFHKFIENFLTPEECDVLISLGEINGLKKMKSSKITNGVLVETDVDYVGNHRMGGYFINDTLMLDDVKSLTNKVLDISNQLNVYKGITYTTIPKYSFNRYSPSDFLDWHEDKHEILRGATITLIIQLNDNYDGGLIRYKLNDVLHSIPKKKGSVFIFDSGITHSVDVVESGFRYSLNAWPSSIKKVSLI
jgi:hypothetical protein